MPKAVRLVTRHSPLALWQAETVRKQLKQFHPELSIEILGKNTLGDQKKEISLNQIGGKTLFVKELQSALLQGEADMAVHSVKDLAAKETPGLKLAAILARGDVRDVLVSEKFRSLDQLPQAAVLGTASPRRQSQLLKQRPDLVIKLLRGNVATRLKKLQAGDYDAIVLAAAGLQRLDLAHHITRYFEINEILPAIGQGAIGVECRADHQWVQELLEPLNHAVTADCVRAERHVNACLGGDCFTPIAAHARYEGDQIILRACVGSLDGREQLFASATGVDSDSLGALIAEELIKKGAFRLLQRL